MSEIIMSYECDLNFSMPSLVLSATSTFTPLSSSKAIKSLESVPYAFHQERYYFSKPQLKT